MLSSKQMQYGQKTNADTYVLKIGQETSIPEVLAISIRLAIYLIELKHYKRESASVANLIGNATKPQN